ncbi:MAG TPA: CGNR zinc finger domain-containing protein [Gaiellaceae bacterium]|jgi:predicted RNA-binding Zn ribbon-like protein|nr:CGNR zinc finger domain-containing protein [Gaiellaceae bacterium]
MVTVLHTQLDLVRDYVNTLDFETGIDRIATPDELADWLSEEGLVDDLVEPTEQEHADALAVREAIRGLLLGNNAVDVDAEAASKTLEEAGRKAHLGVRFENGQPVLAPEGDGARGAIGRIVALVAELAPSDEWKRLKGCRDEHCRVAFYDKSRNRSRAWCSMEVCGNREKARSFRARHKV